MILRKRTLPIVFIGVLGLLGPASAVMGQTIVVTAKSIKDLAGDLEYLVKTVAPEGDPNAENLLGALKQFQAGDLVKGLDQSRGFGLAVTLPPDFPAGDPPSIVAAVPVTDLGALLDSVGGLGIAVDDKPGVEGFSHKVTAPDGNTSLFVLQSKGYALFSLVPAGADKLKAIDPASWAPKGQPGATLAARVRIAELPQAIKEQFLGQFKASMEQQEGRKPGEPDAQYQGRIAAQKAGESTITALVRDGDSIAMAFDLDRKTSEMSLELTIAGRPGTEMARALGAFQGRRSRFQDLGTGGPLAVWASLPVAKVIREGVVRGLDSAQKGELPAGVTTPEQRKLFGRFLELVKSNLEAEELDAGLAFRRGAAGDGTSGHYTMLVGMKVRDGKSFDRLFRDSIAQVKPEEKGIQVTLDAAKAADGTAIHRLTGPFDKNDPKVTRILGKPTLAFAFRDDAIVGAFGEDSTAAVRKVVEGLSTPPASGPGSAGPIALIARLAGLDAFGESDEQREAFRRASAETFRGEAAKKDRFSITLKGEGAAIRLRLAVDVPALKFFAMIGHSSKD
jgi:hypothetical protein